MSGLELLSAGASAVSGVIGLTGAYDSANGTLLGGKIAAQGALDAGAAERTAAYYKAAGLRQSAQAERAGAQVDTFNVLRKRDDLQSTLQARAAASGGGADPTVVALADQIETQGTLSALTEMWKGEDRARGLNDQARGAEMTGDAAYEAAGLRAKGIQIEAQNKSDAAVTAGWSSLLDKGSSMFDRFGERDAKKMSFPDIPVPRAKSRRRASVSFDLSRLGEVKSTFDF